MRLRDRTLLLHGAPKHRVHAESVTVGINNRCITGRRRGCIGRALALFPMLSRVRMRPAIDLRALGRKPLPLRVQFAQEACQLVSCAGT